MSLRHQHIQGYYRSMVSDEDVARVQMLLELLFIRSGVYERDNFSASDVKVLTDSLCTCYWLVALLRFLFFCTYLLCTSCTIFIIHIQVTSTLILLVWWSDGR